MTEIVILANDPRLTLEQRNMLEDRYETRRKKVQNLSQIVRPSATRWHLSRRTQMLRKYGPEIRALHRVDDSAITVAVVLGIFFGQVMIGSQMSTSSLWLNNLLSLTVGAFLAYGSQAMNHILMHSNLPIKKPLALLASSTTLIPWFSYYHSGGHARHHVHAGE